MKNINKKIVKEAPVDYGDYPERMDPKVEKQLGDPEGIYAKNRAFRKGVSDVERLGGTRFKEIVDYIKRYYNNPSNATDEMFKSTMTQEMMRTVRQALMLEQSHKDELKDLSVEIAGKSEGWIPYSKTLDELIESGVITKHPTNGSGTKYEFEFFNVLTYLSESAINPNEFKLKPDNLPKIPIPSNFSFDINDLTPEEIRQLEIEKRHVINALIQGKGKRGQFAYQEFKDRLDEINPRLYPLYNKIMSANDLLYFTNQDLIDMMGGNAAGMSKIESDSDDEDEDGETKETIVGNGLIFPILLHELVKGFATVASREQWRDMDPDLANDIINNTDNMKNEPMQFRVGGELIRKLKTLLPDELTIDLDGRKYLPFFEKLLYSVPADKFLKDIMSNVISEIPADNDKAKRELEIIFKNAKKQYDDYYSDEEEDDDDILSKLGL